MSVELVERLRAALDERERACAKAVRALHPSVPAIVALVDEVLRTIKAHRAILAAYETALVSHEVAAGTALAGATRMSLRIRKEAVDAVASIYFPESDATDG